MAAGYRQVPLNYYPQKNTGAAALEGKELTLGIEFSLHYQSFESFSPYFDEALDSDFVGLRTSEPTKFLYPHLCFPDEPKNWGRRQSMNVQKLILQSLTGVAQSKKERRQEDDSANRPSSSQHTQDRHKLRRKGKRRATDSRGADWRGSGRHGEV